MAKKSWTEKYFNDKHVKAEVLEKDYADMKAGDKMFIASPQILADYILQIPKGNIVSMKRLRKDIAVSNNCDNMCPLTAGIFLRILIEKNYEDYVNGKAIKDIAPFWRVVEPKAPILKKLSFDTTFIFEQQEKEM